MKRLGRVWPEIISFDNLLKAYYKARKSKQSAHGVAQFTLNLEGELLSLQQQLGDLSYQPGDYRLFTIYERKARQIAAAPFRDRVVQHALMNIIEPWIDRRFIFDSYACRKGKGVHAAVNRYQQWAKRYPYVLKMDVEQYFASIDHEILKRKLHHFLKDQYTIELLERIIDKVPEANGRARFNYFATDDLFTPLERAVGVPIGNLTSQFFANLYLNNLDHYIKEQLRAHAYLRYVDDLVVLGRNKDRLHEIRDRVERQLEKSRLRLHPRKAHIYHTAQGIDLFGYQVFPYKRQLRNDNGHAFYRRLRRMAILYKQGLIGWEEIHPRVRSWIGHAMHGETQGLQRTMFATTVFKRG